jgi:serine/threonine-protein kinase HipA
MSDVDATSVTAADVYKGPHIAGILRRDSDDTVFEYTADYLAGDGRPVATTLPKQPNAFRERGGAVPPYFAGLLPEGRRLTAVQAALKTSADDEFSQLVAVGDDCVGDVTVVPRGAPLELRPKRNLPAPHEVSFRQLFSDVLDSPLLHPSVAGVQDKISDQMISVPVSGSFGPTIIKLSPEGYPRLVENEAFFLDVARACNLQVANAQVVKDRDGESALVVARFDRELRTGHEISLAQEDAVQLAGRWPSAKYLMSAREVFAAVAHVSTAPVVEVAKLVRLFAMSYVIGNGDLHAKNVSVYLKDGLWRLTPAYDIVSTLPYGDRTLALETEGRRDNLSAGVFFALAGRHGVSVRVVERILTEVTSACVELIAHVADIGFDERKSADIERTVLKRAKDLEITP